MLTKYRLWMTQKARIKNILVDVVDDVAVVVVVVVVIVELLLLLVFHN